MDSRRDDSDSTARRYDSGQDIRRQREFYKYYEPIRILSKTSPPHCNIGDPSAINNHRPVGGPDGTLTALCQLAALRLRTKRAMLCLFDIEHACILAEATSSSSIHDNGKYAVEDALWLGYSIIPRGVYPCEETLEMSNAAGADSEASDMFRFNIVSDMSKDPRFCNRPCVTGAPNMRFYVGVPIVTPDHIPIGSLCVTDDNPRQGFNQTDKKFMHEISARVMAHLELTKTKTEHERSSRMLSGLNSLVQGPWHPPDNHDSSPTSSHRPRPKSNVSSSTDMSSMGHGTSAESTRSSFSHLAENLSEDPALSDAANALIKATNLIRSSLDVDGALLVDASNGSTSHKTFGAETGDGPESLPPASIEDEAGGDTASNDSSVPFSGITDTDTPCPTLGMSCVDLNKHLVPSEAFVSSLLWQYPRGKVWEFDEAGNCSDDEPATVAQKLSGGTSSENSRQKRRALPSNRVQRTRAAHIAEIRRLFPGIRSVGLIGIWNHSRQKWFAACLVWIYSPTRVLSLEGDLCYLATFCDVIMAEVHRREAHQSEQTKSDFVSSISHELRSPLHGILGSVECLRDQPMDKTARSLTSQIETCGLTLLDTIDHLLDYSKINSRSNIGVLNMKRQLSRASAEEGDDVIKIITAAHSSQEVRLDQITEEAVKTAVYSYCCSKPEQILTGRNVSVILDMDQPHGRNWSCLLQRGAWKRLCINIVSNALKYTDQGYIKVSLEAAPIVDKPKWFKVVLTVADSGRGMTKEYLRDHLFEAFSQEDSFTDGTGLGMSLVSMIVKALGGKIDVDSEKGVGTEIRVTAPMKKPKQVAEDASSASDDLMAAAVANLGVAIVSNSVNKDDAHTSAAQNHGRIELLTVLEKTCTQWNLRPVRISWFEETAAAVFLITESDFVRFCNGQKQHHRPLVVLCRDALSERRLRSSEKTRGLTAPVDYISQPFGPYSLLSAIRSVAQPVNSRPQLGSGVQGRVTPEPIDTTGNSLLEDSEGWSSPGSARPSMLSRKDSQHGTIPSHADDVVMSDVDERLALKEHHDGVHGKNKLPKSSDTQRHASDDARTKDPTATPSSLSLLLVDDNSINLRLLRTYAERSGHPATMATDGQQAVDAYKDMCIKATDDDHETQKAKTGAQAHATKPRLVVIVMDINMPIMDGFEATRLIRIFEKQHNIKPAMMIALTGLGSAEAQRQARLSGFDVFLTKPVRLKSLTEILNGLEL